MPVEHLERADDPRLDDYRDIREAERIRQRGIFLAEGTKVVEALLRSPHRTRSVLLSENKLGSIALPEHVPVYVLPQAQMDRVVGFPIHRGCLASGVRSEADLQQIVRHRTILVLEGVANHDNIGGAFRAASTLGAGGVLLDPTSADPLYRKAIRVSMGAVFSVPFARLSPWPGALDELRRAGFVIWALTPASDARPLTDVARGRLQAPDRLALLFGTEGEGLSPRALAAADERWTIPMTPGTDSLNVSVAAAVALFALAAAGA